MNNVVYKKLFWNTIFIVNLYAILYLWLAGSGELLGSGAPGDVAIAVGRVSGLLLEYLILVELILVSRLVPLEQLYGFDKKNLFHRRLGYVIVASVVLHPILLSLGYAARSGRSAWEQFLSFLTSWEHVVLAVVGLVLMLVAGTLSIPRIRKLLPYEVWYFAHLPLYGAIALAFGHQIQSGDVAFGGALYYWLALNFTVFGIVLAYRFLRPLYKNFHHQFRVSRVVRESRDVVSVYITGRDMESFRFHGGQFARLIFFQKDMWHGHPFSFSAPWNGNEIRFSIKASGDWTRRVPELREGTRVWIEGPLGTFTLEKSVTDKQLFIAGGIGITPIVAMAESGKTRDAKLIYAAKKKEDLVLMDEVDKSGVHPIGVLSDEKREGYEHGFVTPERIGKLCPDFRSRDVYLCGPPIMLTTLTRALLEAGLPREQLHYERFSF
jgi:predicted ferric reductase